jgi:hypothetical protein
MGTPLGTQISFLWILGPNTSIAAIIGAAVGSGVTCLFALVTIWLQRRSDERRQIRELAVWVCELLAKYFPQAVDSAAVLAGSFPFTPGGICSRKSRTATCREHFSRSSLSLKNANIPEF